MKQRITLALTAAAVAAVALTGCAAAGSAATGSTSAAPHSHTSAARTVLQTSSSSLGTIITEPKGNSVYLFTKDTRNSGKSSCYGACAAAWPPVTTTSSTPSVTGISGKIGTITRTDGTKQVTVNGWPVYLFAEDAKAGDVNGQGLMNAWYVLNPSGTAITGSRSGSTSSTSTTPPSSSSGSSWG